MKLGALDGGRDAELGGPENGAGSEHDVAGAQVLAGTADVGASRVLHLDPRNVLARALHRYHGGCAGRQRGAGRDAHGSPGR